MFTPKYASDPRSATTLSEESRLALNRTGSGVAIGLVVLLGFALYALIFFDARPTNHDILLVVITFLTTKIGTVIDFFFSSNVTSKSKDMAIADIAKVAGAATDATVPTIPIAPGETKVLKGTGDQP